MGDRGIDRGIEFFCIPFSCHVSTIVSQRGGLHLVVTSSATVLISPEKCESYEISAIHATTLSQTTDLIAATVETGISVAGNEIADRVDGAALHVLADKGFTKRQMQTLPRYLPSSKESQGSFAGAITRLLIARVVSRYVHKGRIGTLKSRSSPFKSISRVLQKRCRTMFIPTCADCAKISRSHIVKSLRRRAGSEENFLSSVTRHRSEWSNETRLCVTRKGSTAGG